jgi:hypothetical protein
MPYKLRNEIRQKIGVQLLVRSQSKFTEEHQFKAAPPLPTFEAMAYPSDLITRVRKVLKI